MLTLGKTEKGLMKIDFNNFMASRMLIQSVSGGGKSYALRKLLEETHGKAQQIVIDPEGEFSSLRKRFDYVICAPKGGDVVATPQTAIVLAKTLLELGVSAIIDLSELKAHERILFVKRFLESMINAPKKLWHPVLIALDEAHIYCPEKGKAESAGAVIDIATRGRKRGFCLVLATQRLSKLHKDAAAELLNKLIGRTNLDIDVKRAAEELGISPKEAFPLLRSLKAGAFYAYGSALSEGIQKVQIGKVKTSHGKRGKFSEIKTPPPTAKVKKILKKIGDLADQANEEAKTIADFKREVAELKRKVAVALKQGGGILEKEVERRINTAVEKEQQKMIAIQREFKKAFETMELAGSTALSRVNLVLKMKPIILPKAEVSYGSKPSSGVSLKKETSYREPKIYGHSLNHPESSLSTPKQKILDALAILENMGLDGVHRNQVAVFAGVSPKSSSFVNNVSALRTSGFLEYPKSKFLALTSEGKTKAHWPSEVHTNQDLQEAWFNILSKPKATILKVLVDHYPNPMERDQLAHFAGVSSQSSSLMNNISALRSLGAIDYPERGCVVATELLFGKG